MRPSGGLIGIGGDLTASPLPHHRTFGSRIRRFGSLSTIPHAKVLALGSPKQLTAPTYGRACALQAKRYWPLLPFGPSLRPRVGTMPSADSSGALRQDCSSPSRFPWPVTSQDAHEVSRGKSYSLRCLDAGLI